MPRHLQCPVPRHPGTSKKPQRRVLYDNIPMIDEDSNTSSHNHNHNNSDSNMNMNGNANSSSPELVDLDAHRRAWQMYEYNLDKKKNKKGRSIMQRLSNWFEDHLPLRKRDHVKRADRKKASKSVAAPRISYSVNTAQKQTENTDICDQMPFAQSHGSHPMSMSMIGKNSIYDDGYTDQRMHVSCFDDMSFATFTRPSSQFPTNSLSQSFSSAYSSCRAPRIRTNPWIRDRASFRQSSNSAFRPPSKQGSISANRSIYSAPSALSAAAANQNQSQQQQQPQQQLKPPPAELMFSSMDRTAQLRVKSLDESTCSSGYGSQDSSPESSVHSPDWQLISSHTQEPRRNQHSLSQICRPQKQVSDKAIECRSIDVDEACAAMGRDMHHLRRLPAAAFSPRNDDDEHVYHELESLHRLSLLLEEPASSSEYTSPQPTNELSQTSRTSSPIYAVPYDSQRNSLSSENPFLFVDDDVDRRNVYDNLEPESHYSRVQPLSIESPFFRHNTGIVKPKYIQAPEMDCYQQRYQRQLHQQQQKMIGMKLMPQWNCPPPPPVERYCNKNGNGSEGDVLAELDKQIAELQLQSDAVRHLVEQAKERQELRERTRLLCMDHINELRKMRWFMRNNFELCL